jgi:RNA polymerase sigma-70 factor (ECF subfamily)
MKNEMDVKRILDIVMSDYLRKLYAFCLRETRNHADAEDLCQDIVTEIVSSAKSLRQPGALPGWVWTIARRTHWRWMKQREWEQRVQMGLLQDTTGTAYVCPVAKMLEAEQVRQLRREISLLSRVHREVIVQHYLHEKSCAEIAAKMNISESMVKYHLVCARRKIKEGIAMERERGTTSYDPLIFVKCWWGDESYPGEAGEWNRVLDRKLPESILYTAYGKPSTIQDLSIETGVPVVFLEDEVNILLKYGMLEASAGDRYETSLCIVDGDTLAAIFAHFDSEAPAMADQLFAGFQECESDLRSIGFHRSDMDWVQLIWLASIVMNEVLVRRLEGEILTNTPQLTTGGRAWAYMKVGVFRPTLPWGQQTQSPTDNTKNRLLLSNLYPLNQLMDRPHNLGGSHPGRDNWTRAIRLMSTMTGQGLSVDGLSPEDEAECALLVAEHFVENRDGRLLTRIPVFTNAQYEAFCEVVDTRMPFIEAWFRTMHGDCMEILRKRLPKRFLPDISQYGYLEARGSRAMVLEALHDSGRLPIPERHAHAMVIVQAAPAVGG